MAKFEYFLNSVKQSPNPWNLGFGTPNFFQDLFLTVMSACRLVQNWKDPEFLLLLIHNLMKIFVYYNNLGPLIPTANIGASQFQFTPSGCPSRRTRRKGGLTGTQGILYRRMYWPNCPGSHLMLTVVSTLFHLKEQLRWLPPSLVLWSLLSHSSVCAQPKNSFTSRWEVFVPAPILIDFGFWEQLMDWSNIMELKGILSKKFIEPFIPTFLQWFWPRGIFAGGWLAHYKRLMQISF